MFTENSTISFDPTTFGLKVLELDYDELETIFTEDEIKLIEDLSFFQESYVVPTFDNVGMELDSFAIGMYDFIRGCKNLIALPNNEFQDVLKEVPHLISKVHLTEKMELGKQILYKYFPEAKDKIIY